jgi:hypothetical protein
VKKLSLTTGALTAIAASALLTGIAFANDSMRSNDGHGDAVAAIAMSKPADVDNDKVDRDKDIADEQKVDNDVDENENANDEDAANDTDKNDKDNDRDDKTKADTDNDDHGQAVSAVASTNRHGDKHSNRGR